MGVPFAAAFREYHMDHHRHQGVEGLDRPADREGGVSCAGARRSCLVLPADRRLRSSSARVRPRPLTREQMLNVAAQLAFDAWLVHTHGPLPLAWMILSTLFAGGLHPCAGHFFSEHYVFHPAPATQDTTSYYGPLNALTWNVGYHNEHHDFPRVPWSRLPALSRLAAPHYDALVACPSWCGIVWEYVTTPTVGPWSRVRLQADAGAPCEMRNVSR